MTKRPFTIFRCPTSILIPTMKIGRSHDRPFVIVEIHILGRTAFILNSFYQERYGSLMQMSWRHKKRRHHPDLPEYFGLVSKGFVCIQFIFICGKWYIHDTTLFNTTPDWSVRVIIGYVINPWYIESPGLGYIMYIPGWIVVHTLNTLVRGAEYCR